MGDVGDDMRALDAHHKRRKANNLAVAEANSKGWTKHTEFHWSRMLNGKRLDFWPSTTRFQYEGRVMVGNVEAFIRKREATK